jgi:hypothetical protein
MSENALSYPIPPGFPFKNINNFQVYKGRFWLFPLKQRQKFPTGTSGKYDLTIFGQEGINITMIRRPI